MSNPITPLVYGLSLDDNSYRYVGATVVGARRRLYSHRGSVSMGSMSPVHRWMREVGPLRVRISTLEEVDLITDLAAREEHWISELRKAGFPLLNSFNAPYSVTETRLERMSKTRKQRAAPTQEQKNRTKSSLTGTKWSDEDRAKWSEERRKRPLSAKQLEHMRTLNHTSHHVRRGIIKAECSYCTSA